MIFHSNQDIGAYGEKLALKYLKKNGYKKVCLNYKTKHAEIDIIVKNKTHLVFVEVKTRESDSDFKRYGRPARAVNAEKKRHIRYGVHDYLRNHTTELRIRCDIIEVYFDRSDPKKSKIVHIKNAFGE